MGSKLPIIVLVGILFGGIIAGAFFMLRNRSETGSVKLAPIETQLSPTVVPEPELVTYQNESGFSFEHPNNLTIKENVLDAASYADLEIRDDAVPGMITIQIVDSKLKDIAAWKKANTILETAESVDSMLGDVKALQIEDETSMRLIAVDRSVLYTIESEANDMYWKKLFETIVSTWKFELPQESSPAGSANSAPAPVGETIYEEETIE